MKAWTIISCELCSQSFTLKRVEMHDTRTLLVRPQWQWPPRLALVALWGFTLGRKAYTVEMSACRRITCSSSRNFRISTRIPFPGLPWPHKTAHHLQTCLPAFLLQIPAAFGPPPAVCSPHGGGIPRRQARRHSQRKEEEEEEEGSYCIKHFTTLTQTCGHPHFTGAGPDTPQLQEAGTPWTRRRG